MTFIHRGVRAIIPSSQACGVDRALDTNSRGDAITLWPGAPCEESLLLYVVAGDRRAWIRCGDIALRKIPRSELISLSIVLRAALAQLPHVVGMAHTEAGYAWLVDMHRWIMNSETPPERL